MKRVIFSVALIISVFILPWWVSVIFSIAGLFYFKYFYEAIAVGLILDSVYGSQVVFGGFEYALTIISIVIFIAVFFLKKRLFMY